MKSHLSWIQMESRSNWIWKQSKEVKTQKKVKRIQSFSCNHLQILKKQLLSIFKTCDLDPKKKSDPIHTPDKNYENKYIFTYTYCAVGIVPVCFGRD